MTVKNRKHNIFLEILVITLFSSHLYAVGAENKTDNSLVVLAQYVEAVNQINNDISNNDIINCDISKLLDLKQQHEIDQIKSWAVLMLQKIFKSKNTDDFIARMANKCEASLSVRLVANYPQVAELVAATLCLSFLAHVYYVHRDVLNLAILRALNFITFGMFCPRTASKIVDNTLEVIFAPIRLIRSPKHTIAAEPGTALFVVGTLFIAYYLLRKDLKRVFGAKYFSNSETTSSSDLCKLNEEHAKDLDFDDEAK